MRKTARMLIAVTFALPDESKELVHELRHPGATGSGALPSVLGNLGPHEILIIHTGVGKKRAQAAAERLLQDYTPGLLISSGFAGGLDPAIPARSVVLAQNLSDAAMLQTARTALGSHGVFEGLLTTTEMTLETAAEKAMCARDTNGIAVDMESAEIVKVARAHRVPTLTIRVVTDSATEPLPVPFPVWFDEQKQQPKVGALLKYLLANPAVIPDFARFVGNVNGARRVMTEALVRIIEAIC